MCCEDETLAFERENNMKLRINSTIKEIEDIVRNTNILDIGCSGMAQGKSMMNRLIELSERYIGIDKKENAEEFELNKKFEVITCFEVLEHLDNVGLCLNRVKEHLMEDGVFICSVPNIFHMYYKFRKESETHISSFTKVILKQRLDKYFLDVKIKNINFGRTLLAICK